MNIAKKRQKKELTRRNERKIKARLYSQGTNGRLDYQDRKDRKLKKQIEQGRDVSYGR